MLPLLTSIRKCTLIAFINSLERDLHEHVKYYLAGEYLYKPWAFDTILIYLYMCVILVSVNISE